MAAVLGGALLLAALAVRVAVVQRYAERRPDLAARVWPGHPQVLLQSSMGEIGTAAARGQAPGSATLERIREVAAREPLAAEPFLVEGTRALSQGQAARAEALLGEAVARDPRLPAARFILASLYLQQGRAREGLRHVAALVRRLPRAARPLTPALASFARQPGGAQQVAAILRRDPLLRGEVLNALADDPANAALVLTLAGQGPTPGDWQSRLVASLVKAERYGEAYRLWARFANEPERPRESLFDPQFQRTNMPPPFGWSLASGAAGVAEPAPGGGLHLLYYGREDATLASQLMLLAPGRYRLSSGTAGAAPGAAVEWSVVCLPTGRELGRAPIAAGALDFSVPPDCRAQELRLRGMPTDLSAPVDLTLKDLRLQKAGQA